MWQLHFFKGESIQSHIYFGKFRRGLNIFDLKNAKLDTFPQKNISTLKNMKPMTPPPPLNIQGKKK